MINNNYAALFLLAVATHWQVAVADEKPLQIVSEDDYMGEVPKVLTVSRLSQSLVDVPSAVTVIDRETIRAAGIVDLPEVFRLVPGFYVGINAGAFHNTNHVVSYHGMTNAYSGSMQVLINGRSVYSPLYGGVQWSELPIAVADIERIEITRGPNAASYGANSFFGVINIITRSPAELAGASVIATHGNGRNEAFFRYAGKLNDLSYRLTTGYRDDAGVDNRNDFKRTRLLNAQGDYRVNDKNSLEFELGIVGGNREEGILELDPTIFLPRTKDIANHYELIRWRHNISDDSDFSLQAYHSFDSSQDLVTTANLRPLLPAFPALLNSNVAFHNNVEMERFDIEAQHNFSLSSSLRGVWGGSVRRDTMHAPFMLGTNQTDYFDLQRLFGHAEWRPFERLVLNAGAMLEHNDFTGSNISPRASINFKFNPSHTVRLGVSSALRTPNYVEEKFNTRIIIPTVLPNASYLVQYFVDEGNVRPERIVSREIGYLGNFGRISVDTRIFNDDIRDYIHLQKDTEFKVPSGLFLVGGARFTGKNSGDIGVNGFEVQAKWRMMNSTHLLLNYAYVKIAGNEDELKGNLTASMPRSTVSALFTHRFNPQWDASLAYYQTGAVAALGDGSPVGLSRRADFRLARQFSGDHLHGEFSAAVENLFNEHYQEFADYNTLKRRARINVSLDF